MRKLNKRAAEMAIGTLVVIVLAIIVLVVIALGFGMGWSNLWSKITVYFGGGSNVDSIKQACSYACTANSAFDYCCAVREVKYDKSSSVSKLTCDSLMASEKCVNLVCNADICAAVRCAANQVKDACTAPETEDNTKTLDNSGKPIVATQVCCKVATTPSNLPECAFKDASTAATVKCKCGTATCEVGEKCESASNSCA